MNVKTPRSFAMVLRRRYLVFYNPQGNGWYVAYRDATRRQRRSLGARTRPEAEAAVRLLDEPPSAAQQDKHRASWGDVQNGFLQHKLILNRSPATVAHYQTVLDAFGTFIRAQGVKYIDEVNLPMLEGFTSIRLKQGTDVGTVCNNAIILKGLFKWAAKASRGYLGFNPATDWEIAMPLKPKRQTYTAEDVAIMEAGVSAGLRPVITTLAWSGMRINELVNLRWQDIDFERRLIHIRVQDSWRPKGKRDRAVPMDRKVEAILPTQRTGPNVFAGRRGNKLVARSVLRQLHQEQEKLGMAPGDLHAFRRFFATTMIRNGVDVETVRQWGGWKSLSTMLRYLADLNASDSVQAMDKAIARIDSTVNAARRGHRSQTSGLLKSRGGVMPGRPNIGRFFLEPNWK